MTAAPRFFALRISVFYAALFVGGGLVTPFLPVWLQNRGLNPEQIAVCLAFPLAARILFMPIGSWITDHAPNRRFAIVIFTTLSLCLFIPSTLVDHYWPILLLVGLTTTISGLTMPAIDALALTGLRRFGLDYGKMRAWGSISFVVVSVTGGLIFGHFGPPVLTPLMIGAFATAVVFAFILPVTPPLVRAVDDALKPAARSAWSVLSKRSFLVIVASSALVQAGHGAMNSFSTIHWQALGFSGGEIGLIWSTGVIAEIIMFRFSGRLRRVRPETLILIGALVSIVRWAVYPWVTGLAGSLALQSMHALTFAGVYAGMQFAIARDAPEEMTGSAQGICQIASGLLLALSTLLTGPLYTHYGVGAFWAMTVFPVLAVLILVWPVPASVNPTKPVLAG